MGNLLQRLGRGRSNLPLPMVATRDVSTESAPDDGGLQGFETPDAHAIDRARLERLDSLGLELYVFDSETGLLRPASPPAEPEGNAVAAPAGWTPPATSR